MAFRCLRLIKSIKCNKINSNCNASISRNCVSSISKSISDNKFNAAKEFKTESNLTYLEDPNTFGTLTRKAIIKETIEDKGDIREEKFKGELPLQSQKLTTKQYADLIKQYIKHKRLKEALDILEIRMLQYDKVKPENYIYNILIGACADVGYTKKAFKLYNDMKKRALKPTGDTYTCLFTACLNSPWASDGLKNARHLRALMTEKGIEPNLTNYNVMIKTFGRCGDLPTAFKIVDEMIGKKIKIRVHTFNHLLQVCISDKENGLRHALIVWRKMLKMREKPNIYSFNLMLKCVKDCNLGSKEDISDLIAILEENTVLNITTPKTIQIESAPEDTLQNFVDSSSGSPDNIGNICNSISDKGYNNEFENLSNNKEKKDIAIRNDVSVTDIQNRTTMELIHYKKQMPQMQSKRSVPNFLSKTLQMNHVFAIQDVNSLQDKFAIIGGQEDFLKEMEVYSVQPDIKIFTQMLPLIDDSTAAEVKLIEAMQSAKIKPDIDFYNLLIRKRCLRLDYDKAIEVKDVIEKDRKKRHPFNKRQKLKENIMTYGVLALACNTKDKALRLLDEMKGKQIKINIQILGTLLKHGTVNTNFEYIKYIMNEVKEQKALVNNMFLKHLEDFNDKCETIIKENNNKGIVNKGFALAYNSFLHFYKNWHSEVSVEEALKEEHPWQQFREPYPETVQRQNIEIKQPKKFYKRNRKYVMYAPQVK